MARSRSRSRSRARGGGRRGQANQGTFQGQQALVQAFLGLLLGGPQGRTRGRRRGRRSRPESRKTSPEPTRGRSTSVSRVRRVEHVPNLASASGLAGVTSDAVREDVVTGEECQMLGIIGEQHERLDIWTPADTFKKVTDATDKRLVAFVIDFDRSLEGLSGDLRLVVDKNQAANTANQTVASMKKIVSHKCWQLKEVPATLTLQVPKEYSDKLDFSDIKNLPALGVVLNIKRRPADVDDTSVVLGINLQVLWALG